MGENKHLEAIKKHYIKHEEFYKKNKELIIVYTVMTIGFFVSKMWQMKYGTLMFLTVLIIITISLKNPKKKSNKNL